MLNFDCIFSARLIGWIKVLRLKRLIANVALLLPLGTILATTAHALPLVNSENGFSAKSVSISGVAIGFGVDTEVSTSEEFGFPDDEVSLNGLASLTNPIDGRSALSSMSVSAGYGKLRGVALANTIGGPITAQASVRAEFIDLMTILADGQDTRSWNFNMAIEGKMSASILLEGVGASVRTNLQVFDAQIFLNGNGLIVPAYQKVVFQNSRGVKEEAILVDHLERLTPGTLWFVSMSMDLSAASNVNFSILPSAPDSEITAEADFSHTVELFIDPSTDTPWGSFSFASGHDYRTQAVPEPSSLAILAGLAPAWALGYILKRRRRGRVCSIGPKQ